jgi:hypothetical protein
VDFEFCAALMRRARRLDAAGALREWDSGMPKAVQREVSPSTLFGAFPVALLVRA